MFSGFPSSLCTRRSKTTIGLLWREKIFFTQGNLRPLTMSSLGGRWVRIRLGRSSSYYYFQSKTEFAQYTGFGPFNPIERFYQVANHASDQAYFRYGVWSESDRQISDQDSDHFKIRFSVGVLKILFYLAKNTGRMVCYCFFEVYLWKQGSRLLENLSPATSPIFTV